MTVARLRVTLKVAGIWVWPYGSCASLFRRFTDTNVHGTGSGKIWKLEMRGKA